MCAEVVRVNRKMGSKELIKKLKYYIPNIEQMYDYLSNYLINEGSEKLLSNFFPSNLAPEVLSSPTYITLLAKKIALLELGINTVGKVCANSERLDLNPLEKDSLISIIVNFGRPAFLIENGSFPKKDENGNMGGLPPNWWILDIHREKIEETCKSVGRIEPYQSGNEDKAWGTGFLVADDLIMTCIHVIDKFAYPTSSSRVVWKIDQDTDPRIDYAEEYGSKKDIEFNITDIIGVQDAWDIALLRVKKTSSSGEILPRPLVIDSKLTNPIEKRVVYIVGYPFNSSGCGDPEHIKLIFNDLFGYKRLQPGEITGAKLQKPWLLHDCSTLGGNSGSCVIDLEKNTVIGLHFNGQLIQDCNTATALPLLKENKFLKDAGVYFS
jgi:hypothetical protein